MIKFATTMKKAMGKMGLKYEIHSKVPGVDEPHGHDVLHASDLTNEEKPFCPREFALLDKTGKERKGKFIGTSQRYTFMQGRAIESIVRDQMAGHVAIGEWRCMRCHEKTKFGPRPAKHAKCGGTKFEYIEPRFESKITGVSCGIDLIVSLTHEKKFRVVEIKSIKDEIFRELKAPLSEHRMRSNLYLRSIAESNSPWKGLINTEEAIVFYVTKGFGVKDDDLKKHGINDAPFSPFKEFFVKRDDEATYKICLKACILKEWRDGIGPMPDGICPTAMDKRAKSCQVCKECFSGEYPAGK